MSKIKFIVLSNSNTLNMAAFCKTDIGNAKKHPDPKLKKTEDNIIIGANIFGGLNCC